MIINRCKSVLLSILFLSSLGICAESVLKCSEAGSSFNVNVPWSEWKALSSAKLEPKIGEHSRKPDSEADHSAETVLAWNSQYFFIIAHVTDDVFCPGDSMGGFWNNDSIQFAFAPAGNVTPEDIKNNTVEMGAAVLPSGNKVVTTSMPVCYPQGELDIPFNAERSAHETTYKLAVPWRYLGSINPLSDEPFRFNLIINENDGTGRLGWLQLSDGIGDVQGPSKFRIAQFMRSEHGRPLLHIITTKPTVEKSGNVDFGVTVRSATSGMIIRAEAGNQWQEGQIVRLIHEEQLSTVEPVQQIVFSVPAANIGIGNVPIHLSLIGAGGGVAAEAETMVVVNDSNELSDKIAYAKGILSQVNALLKQEQDKKRIVDYLRLRAFLIDHSLRVADLAKPGRKLTGDVAGRYDKIYKDATRYLDAAAPKLLADVQAFVKDTNSPQFAIPKPDLHAPWTVRGGNIYAGDKPITLHGFYCQGDLGFSLYDLACNIRNMDIGPRGFIAEGFKLDPNACSSGAIEYLRRISLRGQKWGEVFELHTSPHYTPSWFKADNHYAWMDSNDGKKLLELTYKGQAEAFKDIKAIKVADLANEWTFWSVSSEAMAGFRQWLKQRHGSVERLNTLWQTNFQSFDEVPNPLASVVEPITPMGVYQPLYPDGIYRSRCPYWDWCCYNTERAAGVVQWMQTNFSKHFPGVLTQIKLVLSSREYRSLAKNFAIGIDPEKILPITDFIGTDASYIRGSMWKGTLFAYDYMKSICPDKPIVCTESHVVPLDDSTAAGEIRRGLFQRFIHGERLNLMFLMNPLAVPEYWVVEARAEDPVTRFNYGAAPDALESFVMTAADLRRLTGQLCFFAQRQPDVLLFYDNAADFNVPTGGSAPGIYAPTALRVYESLLYHDIKVAMVTEAMLAKKLPQAKVIVLAGAQFVSDETVTALKKYISQEGCLVWLGDNLQFNHYGQPRDKAMLKELTISPQVIQMALNPAVYDSAWPQLLAQAKVVPPFATDKNGKRVWGIEILSTKDANGLPLVFLANTNNIRMDFALRFCEPVSYEFTDLITANSTDSSKISLQPNQVMLLHGQVKQPGD